MPRNNFKNSKLKYKIKKCNYKCKYKNGKIKKNGITATLLMNNTDIL